MADNPCGLFPGEVFADENGVYMGDFAYGDGPGGPFGFVACMSYNDSHGCFRSFDSTYRCRDSNPRIHVPFEFGAGAAYTVADSSGPTGLEAVAAMRVDLPGSARCHVGWAGPQVVDDTTGAWKTGLLDGSTGWDPPAGETWAFSCWAKSVPDLDGVTADDIDLSFSVAAEGFSASTITSDVLTLTADWQFFLTMFAGGIIGPGSWLWPLITFNTAENVSDDTCQFFREFHINTYHRRGSLLIKCAHLYPVVAPGGNWIDSFHGHG